MGSKNKKSKTKSPSSKVRVFGAGNKEITDKRFALAENDPRFQDVPKHKNKVAIDSRFSRVFTDKNFSTSSTRVDKRGKVKQDGDSSQNALKQYYRIDEHEKKPSGVESDDDDSNGKDAEILKKKNVKEPILESESESSGEENEDEKKPSSLESDDDDDNDNDAEKVKKKNVKEPILESESESSGEEKEDVDEDEEKLMDDWTSTDTDEDDDVYVEEETADDILQESNVPIIDKETHRLAVVNLDWNQIQATDLYVVLSSFLPKEGQILSVTVYPSEFGIERMQKEEVHGPVGLFDDDNDKGTKDDDTDDDNEIDNEKLRAYELSRLRYYFAEVVCDSIATADYIYKSCDGIEFERSSNKLDLRFIPDSMEFKQPARDVATEAPANYEGVDFQTRALQLSKIDLTWDENEPQRSKKLKRKINAEQESEYVKDELELKEFIASSESETDEDENVGSKKKRKTDAYRALLLSGDGSDEEDEDDNRGDMEVTFKTGLENISKKVNEKKDREAETVWEKNLRKQKEKKKARKNRSKDSSDDESDSFNGEPIEEPGDFFAGESTIKKKVSRDNKSQKPKTDEEGEASRAELELLLADDDGGDANVKGYNLKRNKSKRKKGKHDNIDEEKLPSAAGYDDPRFSSFFSRTEFALDPTDPQFKRSMAYERQMAHKQHKGNLDEHNDSPVGVQASEVDKVDSSKNDKLERSMLIKSIKMKSKQLPLPSDAKKLRKGK